jgi:hypothetical protein
VVRNDLQPGQAGFEACDDGNQIDDDICSNQCAFNDCEPTVRAFEHTGGVQTFVVPECARSFRLEVWGAQGGPTEICGGQTDNDGGLGGYTRGDLEVTPGETLYIYVGGQGIRGGVGGFNGGGNGGRYGAGGGGGTDIRRGGQGLANRLIVAGGGGGGNTGCPNHGTGGAGGGENGADGIRNSGNRTVPTGGTQNAGGRAGTSGVAGQLGAGGGRGQYHDAGGGGGYYGGGGGYAVGGGGGSGYIGGVSNGEMTSGSRSGHGRTVITFGRQ